MPLIKSASREVVGENIKREVAAGRPRKQAIAIALDVQRRAKADGGAISPYSIADTVRDAEQAALDHKRTMSRGDVLRGIGALDRLGRRRAGEMGMAAGGGIDMPFAARAGAKALERSGMIRSPIAGRTDRVPLGVKQNSYIIPADVVSGVGQGNSIAGANAFNQMFKSAPYGAAMPHPSGGGGMRMPTAGMMKGRRGFADGGMAMDDPSGAPPVDIMAAGGEYHVSPDVVAQIGGGDVDRGHSILDAMVAHIRKKTIKTLRKLPKPRKS